MTNKVLFFFSLLLFSLESTAKNHVFSRTECPDVPSTSSSTYPSGNTSSRTNTSTSVSTTTQQQSGSWREETSNGYVINTRNSDGSVTSVSHNKCFCQTGICAVCGGTGGIHNFYFGTFTPCNSCHGTGKCARCNGTLEITYTTTYRLIDEYYTNGAIVLHLYSTKNTISVYSGGIGMIFSDAFKMNEEGGEYVFGGGQVMSGITQPKFRLSRDYSTLCFNGDTYRRTNKETYDKKSATISKFQAGAAAYGGGTSSPSNSGTSTGSSSNSSRKSSKSSNTRNKSQGVDVIEYAPDYTGSDTKYWCDKCQAYKKRHIHKTI